MYETNSLYFSDALRQSMLSYAKYAKVISTIFLVFTCLGLFTMIGSLFFLSSFGMEGFSIVEFGLAIPVTIVYIVVILAYAYLIYLLYNHSDLLISAIRSEDQVTLELAYEKLATFFKLILYYFISVVVLYGVMMIGFFFFFSQIGSDYGQPF